MALGLEKEADPNIGREIASALTLDEVIGVGTTGRVYRATQIGFGRTFAVKLLHPFLVHTKEVKERFHREARLMARLVHPSIVSVVDSGELPPTTDSVNGQSYLVYEYLEGQTLRQLLNSTSAVNPPLAIAIVLSLADAIGTSHEKNIVHRDLKPENVMSVAREHGKFRFVVLDFGLARALDGDTDPLTRAGAILGTPQYMSPEAARGEPASPGSDVYALATILYELLAGHPPFHGASPIAILAQQVKSDVPPLSPALGLPPCLVDFVMSNLDKDPKIRCPNGTDFACQLLKIAVSTGHFPEFISTPQSPASLIALEQSLRKVVQTA